MNLYRLNWYALLIAIIKYKDGDEALRLMGIKPFAKDYERIRKREEYVNENIQSR